MASVPLLQGCYTQGETYEEALENIKDAIRLHIEARKERGEPVPVEVAIDEVRGRCLSFDRPDVRSGQ